MRKGSQPSTVVLLYKVVSFSLSFQGVDYAAMGESSDFQDYIKHTAELQRVKLDGMTREEKLAFFINVYNALVIHANVARGPPINLWQRYKVNWKRYSKNHLTQHRHNRFNNG